MPEHRIRIWYKDSTFVDVPESQAWEHYDDPDFDRTESLDDIIIVESADTAPYGDDQ